MQPHILSVEPDEDVFVPVVEGPIGLAMDLCTIFAVLAHCAVGLVFSYYPTNVPLLLRGIQLLSPHSTVYSCFGLVHLGKLNFMSQDMAIILGTSSAACSFS